jgi:hypothetical protein
MTDNRNFRVVHFSLAAALAHLDQADDGRSAVNAGLARDPTLTIDHFRAGPPSNNPVFLARRERIALGMRKPGCQSNERKPETGGDPVPCPPIVTFCWGFGRCLLRAV